MAEQKQVTHIMRKKLILLTLILLGAGAAAQTQDAVINLSVAQLRAEPDYESALETQSLMGTPVAIIDSTSYWRRIVTPDYTAWVNVLALAPMPEGYREAMKYICTAEYSHVYAEANAKSDRLSDLVAGDLLRMDGVLKINMYGGGKKMTPKKKGTFCGVILPDGRQGWVPASDLAEFSDWAAAANPTAAAIIETARQYVGVPYLWGGNSPKGFDCSGLVQHSFFLNGLLLPRNASQMVQLGQSVDVSHVLEGDFSTLQSGDLLFFGNKETGKVTHVGLYIGGDRFIHSSQVVRINSLISTAPDYYENSYRLLTARRVLGSSDVTPLTRSPYYF